MLKWVATVASAVWLSLLLLLAIGGDKPGVHLVQFQMLWTATAMVLWAIHWK